MKKTLLKSLFAMACLLSSINVSAYDFEVDGICYNVVSFTELTCNVTKNVGYYEGNIVIPKTVNYANRTLTVVGIEDKVFKYCYNLTSITIPNTISSIGDEMFNGCSKLESVTIEDGETTLKLGANLITSSPGGRGLFYDCPIKTIYLGRDLLYSTTHYYGWSPFYNKQTIKDVTISNSVTSIRDYAFHSCSGLTNVTIGNSVTSIGDYAFRSCSGLTSVTIGNSVKSIGVHAFQYCSGITNVTIGNSVNSIGDYAFWGCSFANVTIPNSVTEIGDCAFYDCNLLTSVTIGNSVTSIGSSAFAYCSKLTNVTIPNSVTSLSDRVFAGCSGLTSVTIGNSVKSIGSYMLNGCDALTTLYSLNTTPPSVGSNCFTSTHYITLNVYVPEEAVEAYQKADQWRNFWNMQGFDPTGIESIKGDAINGNNVYYDLHGNRLDAPKKGLNIINGKKVIVK